MCIHLNRSGPETILQSYVNPKLVASGLYYSLTGIFSNNSFNYNKI